MASSIERWPLDKLIPYARNACTHSDAQVAQIAASIKEFGFVNPILAGPDGVIIAGHGRLLAARKLGMKEVRQNELTQAHSAETGTGLKRRNRSRHTPRKGKRSGCR